MNIVTKYLVSIFSLVLFLTTTSGFTIYSHFCSNTLEKKQSVIASQIICEHNNKTTDIHNHCDLIQGCCSSHDNDEKSANGCCSDNQQFIKIVDSFDMPSEENTNNLKISYIVLALSTTLIEDTVDNYKQEISSFSLPPPISGKQIIILYHKLKTNPELSV